MRITRWMLAGAAVLVVSAQAWSQHKPVVPPLPTPGLPAPVEVRTTPLPQVTAPALPPRPGELPAPLPRTMPEGSGPPPIIEVPVPEDPFAAARLVYANQCSGCHGPDGRRNPARNLATVHERRDLAGILEFIKHGPGLMEPVYPELVNDQEAEQVAQFLAAGMPAPPQ